MPRYAKILSVLLVALLLFGFFAPVIQARISNPGAGVQQSSSGITSLGSQTGATQTFANDTNVTMSSAANTHTLGWTGTLAATRGGTGWAALQANTVLLGNGTGAVATTSAGTNGQVLALVGGVPVWVSTTTLSTITGTLAVAKGGTGLTTFGGANTVLFTTAADTLSSNANDLVWDNTNARLGIGSSTPKRSLVASSTASVEATLTDGATITFDLRAYNQAKVTLTDNRTIDFINQNEALGQSIRFLVCQDGTGSRTLTWDSAIRWVGGAAPTLTTTANKCDIIAGFTTGGTSTPIIVLDKGLAI